MKAKTTTTERRDLKMETKKKNLRVRSADDIKVLTEEAKNIILDAEKNNKNTIFSLNAEKSQELLNGYLGKCRTKNAMKSSFLYSVARVLSTLGYAKRETFGLTKEMVNDNKRISVKNGVITFNFKDKTHYIK